MSKEHYGKHITYLLVAVVVFILFNQWQVFALSSGLSGTSHSFKTSFFKSSSDKSLDNVNIDELKSTAHSVAALFPLEDISSQQDALNIMVPTGMPEYGEELGVSFDDPVSALSLLANAYPALSNKVKSEDPEAWNRWINLATKPVGISCEYCCGVGPTGVDKNGRSLCGCQHNPALLTLSLWMTQNTDYSDAEVLKETLKWKALFFPKNMVELSMSLAGGDTSALENLPGMVGGC